jgi:hypothetical protein
MSDPIFQLTVKADIDEVTRHLTTLERKQLPFATSWALNQTAWQIRKDIQQDMRRIFHAPTRYTLNQVHYRKTTKRDLRSSVYIEPPGVVGKSHLQVHIQGGVRSLKRSEQHLRMTNVLPSGRYTVPSTRLLNAAGNISGARMVRILSGVRGFTERGFLANVTSRSKARNPSRAQYFVARPDRRHASRTRHLGPGIYERTKRRPRPALLFTRAPVYRKRFPFHQLCAAHARRIFPTQIRIALAKAIATAK